MNAGDICRTFFTVALAVFFLAGASSAAESLLPPDSTTTGAELMDRTAALTGDTSAVGPIETQYFFAHSPVPGADAPASLEIWWARPNLFRVYTLLPDGSHSEFGYDGNVCWKIDPAKGPQILSSTEGDDFALTINPDRFLRWRDVYLAADLIGTDTVFDDTCDVLLLVPDHGRPHRLYLSRRAGLPVKISADRVIGGDTVSVASYLSRFRATGGLLLPWQTFTAVNDETEVLRIDSLAFNVTLPVDIFRPPDAVRATAAPPRE